MHLTPELLPALLLAALQVGPNQSTVPLTDGHAELRDRAPRESSEAPMNPTAQWLAECLNQLSEDAARAHTMAQIQRNASQGADRVVANHCLGLAASELGRWTDAVTAFTAAREEVPVEEMRAKARFGAMAGNAALAGGDLQSAERILLQARLDAATAASAPLQAITASDRARALVALSREEEALTELQLATSLLPNEAPNWLLYATLLRRLDRLDEAQTAIERAADLAPADPQIGLEAGVIAVMSGREEAARQSWESVLQVAPGTPVAQTAQDYLAQLGPPPA